MHRHSIHTSTTTGAAITNIGSAPIQASALFSQMRGWGAQPRIRIDQLNCVVCEGTPGKGTLVFLHGLGDDGSGWCEQWAAALPGVRVVCPNASDMAVTLNGGASMPAWFDMSTLTSLLEPQHDGCTGLSDSVGRVRAVLERELASGEPVVLGGFSQGAVVAAHAGLAHPTPLRGLLLVSGWPAAWRALAPHDANRAVPIQVHHGQHDNVIGPVFGQALLHRVRELDGHTVEAFSHPNTAHSIGPGMSAARAFVLKALQ